MVNKEEQNSENQQIQLFENNRIRSVWNEEEQQWYFSVVDVVAILTESPTPRQYWGKIKDREFTKLQLSPIWVQLKMNKEAESRHAGGFRGTQVSAVSFVKKSAVKNYILPFPTFILKTYIQPL